MVDVVDRDEFLRFQTQLGNLAEIVERTRRELKETQVWVGDLQQAMAGQSAGEDSPGYMKYLIRYNLKTGKFWCPTCAMEWEGDDEFPIPMYCPYCQNERCPDCGSTNVNGPDEEGLYDCMDCGIFWGGKLE